MTDQHVKEYKIAKSKIHHGFLLSAVLAIVGLAFLFLADDEFANKEVAAGAILIAAIVIFGLNWRTLRQSQTILRLSEKGIWYKGWQIDLLPWQRITKIYTKGSRMQSFLYLELRDFNAFMAGKGHAGTRNSRLIKAPALLVAFADVEADPVELTGRIQELFDKHR